eukprot:SAG31_NODE_4319_length_3362_cov_2.182041_2_plen_94_part_00
MRVPDYRELAAALAPFRKLSGQRSKHAPQWLLVSTGGMALQQLSSLPPPQSAVKREAICQSLSCALFLLLLFSGGRMGEGGEERLCWKRRTEG